MTCLETSFLVDLLRGDESATDMATSLDDAGERPTVTPIAAAEVEVGANLGDAPERDAVDELLESLTWLAFTRDGARRAGRLQATLAREGEPIAFTDCMIAAIALEHDEPLLTRDADFERIPGLDLRTY